VIYRRSRNRDRKTPTNSAFWRKLRGSVLSDEPLCRMCKSAGMVTAATCVDHIDNDDGNNDRSNLQPLCIECHGVKTVIDSGFKPKLRGWI